MMIISWISGPAAQGRARRDQPGRSSAAIQPKRTGANNLHRIIHGHIPPISHVTDVEAAAPDELDNRRVASCQASMAPACQRQVGARAVRHRTSPELRGPVPTNRHASMMSIQKFRLLNRDAPRPRGGSSLNSGPRFPRIRPEITSGQILDRMTECPPAPVAKSRGRPVCQDQVFLEVVSGSAWVLRIAGGNRPLPCAFSHLSFARLSNSCRSTPHDSCTSPVGGDIRVPPSGSTPRSPDFPCIRPCGAWQIPGDTTAARMNVGHVHQP